MIILIVILNCETSVNVMHYFATGFVACYCNVFVFLYLIYLVTGLWNIKFSTI